MFMFGRSRGGHRSRLRDLFLPGDKSLPGWRLLKVRPKVGENSVWLQQAAGLRLRLHLRFHLYLRLCLLIALSWSLTAVERRTYRTERHSGSLGVCLRVLGLT